MPGNQDVSNPDFTCTISITDDDNSAYIGQRNHHPYGGTWQTTPHCYTHGCGVAVARLPSGGHPGIVAAITVPMTA